MRVIKYQEEALSVLSGTFKVGSINLVHYDELVAILGEPTFNEESADGKVQVEWVIELDGNVFTIYDWKTYDREYTKNNLTTWSIGGSTAPHKLELKIYKKLNEYGKQVY